MKVIIVTITAVALALFLMFGIGQKSSENRSDELWAAITRNADEDDLQTIETDDYTIQSYIIHEEIR